MTETIIDQISSKERYLVLQRGKESEKQKTKDETDTFVLQIFSRSRIICLNQWEHSSTIGCITI